MMYQQYQDDYSLLGDLECGVPNLAFRHSDPFLPFPLGQACAFASDSPLLPDPTLPTSLEGIEIFPSPIPGEFLVMTGNGEEPLVPVPAAHIELLRKKQQKRTQLLAPRPSIMLPAWADESEPLPLLGSLSPLSDSGSHFFRRPSSPPSSPTMPSLLHSLPQPPSPSLPSPPLSPLLDLARVYSPLHLGPSSRPTAEHFQWPVPVSEEKRDLDAFAVAGASEDALPLSLAPFLSLPSLALPRLGRVASGPEDGGLPPLVDGECPIMSAIGQAIQQQQQLEPYAGSGPAPRRRRRSDEPHNQQEEQERRANRLKRKSELTRLRKEKYKVRVGELECEVERLKQELSHEYAILKQQKKKRKLTQGMNVGDGSAEVVAAPLRTEPAEMHETNARLQRVMAELDPAIRGNTFAHFFQWLLTQQPQFYEASHSLWSSLFQEELGVDAGQLAALDSLRLPLGQTTPPVTLAQAWGQFCGAAKQHISTSRFVWEQLATILDQAQLSKLLTWIEMYARVCVQINA